MDAEDKTKSLKKELEALGAEEAFLRNRLGQLKQMLEEKKKRVDSIEQLKKQEADLLALLK